jgi:hypothetical protein
MVKIMKCGRLQKLALEKHIIIEYKWTIKGFDIGV